MATRSTISKLNNDGSLTRIYCHWDGYLSYNGRILFESYNTEERVDELLALGSLSTLGSKLKGTEKHTVYNIEDDTVLAYHRDRQDHVGDYLKKITTIIPPITDNSTTDTDEDYNYVFKDGKWYYYRRNYGDMEELTAEKVAEN